MKDPSNPEFTPTLSEESTSESSSDQRLSPESERALESKVEAPQTSEDAGTIAGESVEQVGAVGGEFPVAKATTREPSSGRSAFLVGAGILISRIIGLVRQRVFAHYFGLSDAGDAFNAAFRIPNFLQNVFGEGALSASFIPVYAKLLSRGDKQQATKLANAILTLLVLTSSIIVLIGVLTTPYLIRLIAPGFEGEKRELTISLVRIFFPGAGLLVFSAWCLGILNSHRRFFLSYTAPVVWNLAIIASLIFFGGRLGQFQLAEMVAWGSVIGSALQFGVQLPTVILLVKGLRPVLDTATANVRLVIRNFFPVFFSRSVVQISAFVDAWLASWLGTGAVAALAYTQSIYTLPVSLFGMSVSAAELPTMSSAVGTDEQVSMVLRNRLNDGLRRIAFFIVPSATAFLFLGDIIAAVLYQTGEFRHEAAVYLWGILAGSGIGLLAATLGRLYSSTYYALHDTRTPLVYAIIHVVLATCFGYLWSLPLPRMLGIDLKWGVVGLTASASLGAWVEFLLLRRKLNRRIGHTGLTSSYVVKLWTAALIGAAIAWGLKWLTASLHPIPVAVVVLGGFGVVYFLITYFMSISESRVVVGRVLRILKLGK
ncbi:MAG TPA: murein biosynthesis integral membrane protein MurJ [Pyrinomonadaceae bacterium]|nr:murein biosynthesis integral membrane protein MurJ [Pyrinomonadaceae bacterium]